MTPQEEAKTLFEEAFRHQRDGNLEEAVRLYLSSIQAHPTAEAHTFLGWTYSWQGKIDEAIAECLLAIEVDSTLGNPYNDIGVYLIAQDELDDAIPWLERATRAPRYECPQFPWMNLGRVYARKDMQVKAVECFLKARDLAPDDPAAALAHEEAAAVLN